MKDRETVTGIRSNFIEVTCIVHHSGIRRILWISLFNAVAVASLLKKDQQAHE